METSNINVSQRIKSEQSLRNKWVKNLGKKKQLRKWLNAIPSKPDGIEIGYIKYLYEIVYASQGGG